MDNVLRPTHQTLAPVSTTFQGLFNQRGFDCLFVCLFVFSVCLFVLKVLNWKSWMDLFHLQFFHLISDDHDDAGLAYATMIDDITDADEWDEIDVWNVWLYLFI
jgi:hypothetical protein